MSDGRVHIGRAWAVATQVGVVAGGGMVLGWALSYDLDQSTAAAGRECAGSRNFCIGVAVPVGYALGLAIIAGGCWLCFSVARLRPRAVTIPAGILAAIVVTLRYAAAIPGGELHPAWLFGLVMAAVFGLLTAGVILLQAAAPPRWPRLLGGAMLIVPLVVAGIVPGIVLRTKARDAERAKLVALGFPLVVPVVTGYKVGNVFPDGHVLSIFMVPNGARRDQWGAYETAAFSVNIGTSDSQADVLGLCPSHCRAIGPDQWLTTGGVSQEVVVRHGDLVAVAADASAGTPEQVLVLAATVLRPTTIDAVLATE